MVIKFISRLTQTAATPMVVSSFLQVVSLPQFRNRLTVETFEEVDNIQTFAGDMTLDVPQCAIRCNEIFTLLKVIQ